MGVLIYLLDTRKVKLRIGALVKSIGTLRSFRKMTEVDGSDASYLDSLDLSARKIYGPVAVMTADFESCALATSPNRTTAAHMVLGWESGLSRTNDQNWDYLPILGYAVRNSSSCEYTLHEKRSELLHPLTATRATELGILSPHGKLTRKGQPSIIYCGHVLPYISTYAEAKCVFDNGDTFDLLTRIEGVGLPGPEWYVGKRPSEVKCYVGA
jgi:hypothetical protein